MKKLLVSLSLILAMLGGTLAVTKPVAAATDDNKALDSTATVNVDATNPDNPNPEDGRLLLKSVPDFHYGTLSARQIFNGFQDQQAQADGQLVIVDNRLGDDQWQLSVKADAFKRADQQSLNAGLLQLMALPMAADQADTTASINGKVPTDGATHVLTTNRSGLHGLVKYNFAKSDNTLSLDATNRLAIKTNDTFTAPLTWTLAASQPAVKPL
ncbi:WxL domain-containing protein [Lapidilactobacillus wuchangensis]|uniref:WxL domain-containing protein n=1 Tax=Lapidilactobacillus wuchangensis TaxID=2486001 RepID=UPI000F79C8E0|nr:WxL domain-containing protein [Lapidilactobacillus wuchangensis]